jgi:hypothetical protein
MARKTNVCSSKKRIPRAEPASTVGHGKHGCRGRLAESQLVPFGFVGFGDSHQFLQQGQILLALGFASPAGVPFQPSCSAARARRSGVNVVRMGIAAGSGVFLSSVNDVVG